MEISAYSVSTSNTAISSHPKRLEPISITASQIWLRPPASTASLSLCVTAYNRLHTVWRSAEGLVSRQCFKYSRERASSNSAREVAAFLSTFVGLVEFSGDLKLI